MILCAELQETDFSKYADYPFDQLMPDFFVPADGYPVPKVVKELRADQKEITNWLSKTIGNNSFNIEELRQEASDRKYYRIKADNVSYVLADNFDEQDQSANFLCKNFKNSSKYYGSFSILEIQISFIAGSWWQSLDTDNEFKDEKILKWH